MPHSGAGRRLLSNFGYDTRDLTLPRVLDRQCAEQPDKVFLTFTGDGRRFTYAQLRGGARRLAGGLARLGVGKGDHVALLMDNSPEFLLLVFGLSMLGAVVVPVNTAAKGRLLHYYLAQSDSVLLLVDHGLVDRLAAIDPAGLKLARIIVVGEGGAQAEVADRRLAWPDVRDYAIDLPGAEGAAPCDVVRCHDLAFLSYTSGTTGPSKGNMLSQAAALSVGLSNAEHYGYRSDDVVYTCLPLFHLNALQAATLGALVSGASLVLSRRFSVTRYWTEIRESGATITNLLGSMLHFLWNQPRSGGDADHALRFASCVPVPRFAREFERRFGFAIVSNYALSDYCMVTAFTTEDAADKLGSAGKPRLNVEVRIADDDDFELPDGRTGEIQVRMNMPWRSASGYYNMPEATLESRRNLWFHTGDRGYFDADGHLWFVDRKKDAIRRRGENISAFELERILDAHPAVAESAAFPVRADGAEDEVGVAVVLRPDARLDEAALVAYCMDNMAYFMVPRYVDIVAELPRTLNQKVEKYRLRQAVEQALDRIWDRERAGIVVRR